MNFFSGQNRVKTPTFPQQSQLPSNPARSSARPRNAPQSARPKLTQRISSFPATRNTSQTQKSPVDGSDTPFAFMPEEYSEFYVGVVDPMVIVTILQEKLMNNLYDPLPPTDNGSLCQIFESYRSLITENETLRAQRDEGIQRRQLAESSLAEGKQQWAEEEKAYKVEIKKLETLVAHSNHGIEGVVKARRDSVVRKKKRESLELVRESKEDGRETVYEFLASYRMDDKSASRKAVVSGSAGPVQRTKNLLKKFSTTSLTDLHTISSSDDDQPSSLPDNSRLAAIVPAKDESLRQHIDAQANTFEVASETQFTPSSTKSAEARSSHDLVITTSQGSSAQAVDQGQRGASNTTGFDSAISHLKNWMPRKNNKKTTFVAGEIDRGPAMVIPGRPYRQSSPVEAQRSQRLGERDLRNRFSFYAGDESDFVRRKSPAASPSPARHRSLSLSEVPSPQKEDRSAQYQAPDTTRPSSMDTIRRVTMTAPPTDGLFEPRKASRSSVATTVHKPKAASDPLDRAVSTTRLEPGDVPFHGTNGSVRQRRNAVAEPLRTIENAEKTSLAVTGVAKATIASACRDDENSSPIRDRKRKDGGKCKRKTGKNNGA